MENFFLILVLCILVVWILNGKKRKAKKRKRINRKQIIYGQGGISEVAEANSSVSLEDRIKSAIPSKNGLYPHEILMLSQANSYVMNDNNFPGYWFYSYDVKKPMNLIDSLLAKGFLQKEATLDAIKRSKTDKLKETLREYSLKVSGKKDELVDRLVSEVPIGNLESSFPSERFVPSEKGNQELQENAYVEYIHKHGSRYELDIWEMNKLVNEPPVCSYRDKIWKHLNQICIGKIRKREFGLYRNLRLSMSEFLNEEKKYLSALGMLVEVMSYDLSGLYNGFNPEFNYMTYFPYKESMVKIPSGIIHQLSLLCEELKLNESGLRQFFTEKFSAFKTIQQLFTVEESVNIVFAEREKDFDTLCKIYDIAGKRYKKHKQRK